MKKIFTIISSPITYLLALNFLAILLFIFLGFIAGEVILPGILSNYISLGKISGILFLIINLIIILAKEQNITYEKSIINKYFSILIYCIVTFLTFVSLWKFGIILDLILTIISLFMFILFKKYLIEDLEKEEK
jgi:hypothetical protein